MGGHFDHWCSQGGGSISLFRVLSDVVMDVAIVADCMVRARV
jgi:hypothetical protein